MRCFVWGDRNGMDVLSGVPKVTCDVLSGEAEMAWIFYLGWQFFVGCFVFGGKNDMDFFVPGCFVLHWTS